MMKIVWLPPFWSWPSFTTPPPPLQSLVWYNSRNEQLGPLLPFHDLDFSSNCKVQWVLRAHIKADRICWPIYLKTSLYIIVQVVMGHERIAAFPLWISMSLLCFGKRTWKWIYSMKLLDFFFSHQQICSGFTQTSFGEIGLNMSINII